MRDRHRRALLGGWLATKLFHVVTLHGFFNLSTWLTAIAGAAVLLLAYHLVTSRSSRPQPQPQQRPRSVTPVGAPLNAQAPHRLPSTASRRV